MEAVEMSKTYQYRKVMKPMLERKRRARINKCLDELKDLMVECMSDQGENFAKLEKADILELTVDHLKKLRRRGSSESAKESFRCGFVHAANEVSRALASLEEVDIKLGTTLMTHLGYRLNQIQVRLEPTVSKSAPSEAITPLSICCSDSNYNSAQLSPASSGYGSDTEFLPGTQGLLQIAQVHKKQSVWRPW